MNTHMYDAIHSQLCLKAFEIETEKPPHSCTIPPPQFQSWVYHLVPNHKTWLLYSWSSFGTKESLSFEYKVPHLSPIKFWIFTDFLCELQQPTSCQSYHDSSPASLYPNHTVERNLHGRLWCHWFLLMRLNVAHAVWSLGHSSTRILGTRLKNCIFSGTFHQWMTNIHIQWTIGGWSCPLKNSLSLKWMHFVHPKIQLF